MYGEQVSANVVESQKGPREEQANEMRCTKNWLEGLAAVKSTTKPEASWCFTLSRCHMKLTASKFKTNKTVSSLCVEPACIICYHLESDLAAGKRAG